MIDARGPSTFGALGETIVGQEGVIEALLLALLRQRSRAARRTAGIGQNARLPFAWRRRSKAISNAFSLPPTPPERHRRHANLRSEGKRFCHCFGPDLRQRRAGDEINRAAGQSTVRASRGDAGTSSHDRATDRTYCPIRSW